MSTNGQPTRLARLERRYGLGGPCPCRAEVHVAGFDDDLRRPLAEVCERCGRRRPAVRVVAYRLDGMAAAMTGPQRLRLDELLERVEAGGMAALTGEEVAEGATLLALAAGEVPGWWVR